MRQGDGLPAGNESPRGRDLIIRIPPSAVAADPPIRPAQTQDVIRQRGPCGGNPAVHFRAIKQQGELFGHQVTGEGRYFELRRVRFPRSSRVDRGSRFGFHESRAGLQRHDLLDLSQAAQLGNLSKIDAVQAVSALEHARGKLPPEAVASSPGLGGLARLMRRTELSVRVHFGRRRSTWRPAGLEARGRMEAGRTGQNSARPERCNRKGPDARFYPAARPLARQRDAVLGPGRLFPFPYRLPSQRAEIVTAAFDGAGVLRVELQRSDRRQSVHLRSHQLGGQGSYRRVYPRDRRRRLRTGEGGRGSA